MERLTPEGYSLAAPLFAPVDFHLAAQAVLAGATPGEVWVDDARQPKAALVRALHRYHLAGDPGLEPFNTALHRLFVEEIYPRAVQAGDVAFSLYYSAGWERSIEDQILAGLDPIPGARQYYEFREAQVDWRALVPEDLRMVDVDAALAADRSLTNLDDLLEEMLSERDSVDAFLANSFGCCLRSADQIVTWCLSEYNLGDRCEVGIATTDGYRKRGLATITGASFVEMARARGMRRIGWHCWTSNTGSWATALKIGFEKVTDYPSYLAFFQRAFSLAVNGDALLDKGEYAQADEWLARSLATGEAPVWAYVASARAAARLGQPERALDLIEQALSRGYPYRVYLEESEDLASLRDLPRWKAVTAPLG